MKLIVSCVVLCSVWLNVYAHIEITDDNSAFDSGLKQWKQMIPGPTVTIPGSVLGLENDMVVSDIGTLKRTGETSTRYHINDLTFFGSFGFADLKLSDLTLKSEGDFVTLGGTPLDHATITSPDNAIDVQYSGKAQPEGCFISWAKFKIARMQGVQLNGNDVTKEFNEKALPLLNQKLNEKPFLELLNQSMTFCKDTPLRKLIYGS